MPLACLVLLLGGCGQKQTPEELLPQAEARLAANDAAGAPKEEVVGDLARVLLASGEQRRVIDLVGDVGQWSQPRRLGLALSKAEAA